MPRQPVDRLSADDLMSLHGDAGTVPMQVGGILWLEPGRVRPEELLAHLARRLPAAPRLRTVMHRVPRGCGRPVWVDDPGFRLDDHVASAPVGGDADVEALATAALTDPLPLDRPPWAGRLAVSGDGSVRAVILVVHHVLADGMAALGVLAALADGAEPEDDEFPRPLPSRADLVADNLRGRLAGVRRLPSALLELGMAVRLMAASGTVPPTSLNQPTGARRTLVTVTRDLSEVRAAAHDSGGSVNDAALAVIAGALRTVLVRRGEDPEGFVFSVPFAYHAPGTATGNASAVMPLRVPAVGSAAARVSAAAQVTGAAKRRPRALGNSILRPAFRLMVRLGWFRRFIDNQRQVNTIVTNVRGPAEQLFLAGCRVQHIVPLTVATGNITVAFAIFSYAGGLSVTAMADPATWPDLAELARAIEEQWDELLPHEELRPPQAAS
jgi:WS/DGAT/MGAT family acyltransferase